MNGEGDQLQLVPGTEKPIAGLGAPPPAAAPTTPPAPSGPAAPPAPLQLVPGTEKPIAGVSWRQTPALTPSTNAQPVQPAMTGAITDKATPTEGTYLMLGPQGPQQIPYSKVPLAKQQGYAFGGPNQFNPKALGTMSLREIRLPAEEQRYRADSAWAYGQKVAQDLLSDPRGRELVEGDGLDLVLGATKEAARTAVGLHDITPGLGKPQLGLTDLAEGRTQPKKSALRQFSEEPNQNFGEYMGGALEQGAEFMSGEKILAALPRVLGYVPKLGEAAKILKEIESGSTAGRLIMQSIKQGTVAAGQSYVKSGGSLGEAGASGALTTGISLAAGAPAALLARGLEPEATQVVEGVTMPKPKTPVPTPGESAAGEAFGKTAGGAIEGPLRAINEAGEHPVMVSQPGGAPAVPKAAENPPGFIGPPRAATARLSEEVVPQIDVDRVLNRTGDYTTARSELANALNSATARLDQATEGRYSQLKEEITAARNAQYNNGSEGNTKAYRDKLAEMQDLLTKTKGIRPEMRDALTAGWRHYAVMEDVTKGLDRALMGLPGDSAVSGTYRGINGQTLLTELGNMIRNHTRPVVEQALGGPERLESLRAIGEYASTNAGRKSLNDAMKEVAKWGAVFLGGKVGLEMGGGRGAMTGAMVGKATAEAGPALLQKVREAVLARPKIAKLLLYAAQYGAKPENYGPFIAKAIRDIEDQAEKEEKEYANQTR